jgi:VanZ family protein
VKIIRRWLPALLLMALIFILSSVEGQSIDEAGLGDETLHVLGHFVIYFALAITLFRATKSIVLAVLITALYGFSDELHQAFVPGRSASMKDIFIDSLAGLTAGLILWRFYPKLPKILKNWLEV